MVTTKCKYIDDFLEPIRNGEESACEDMILAAKYIFAELDNPDVFIDVDKTEKAKELIERYFDMVLFPWELFVLALVHCYYISDDSLVFTEYFIMMGRGNGKNGFISGLAWYLTTHYHGIQGYNVDIIANAEDQAKTSFDDVYDMLERTWEKSKKFFYKSKEIIRNLKTRSYIKFNTSNARTKDGKRSACLIFDEEHEYESGESIRVFSSGFGKRKHSRIFKITTNGYVREGVLDDDLTIAENVLKGEIKHSRICPLIFRMESDEECDNPDLWVKANPSLPYLPILRQQIEFEFAKKDYDKNVNLDFYTKRMNRPRSGQESPVTEWANIAATNKPINYDWLQGKNCTVGVDFASFRDWAGANFHFRDGNRRIDFGRYWICLKNPDLFRVKAPWKDWVDMKLLTPVDDVEISPNMITDWIAETAENYNVVKMAIDNFRLALIKNSLESIGFDSKERKNLYCTRPSDIMKVQPVIDSCFNNHYFVWDNNPPLRWATNNTKLVRSGKKEGTDTGNFYYAKIEAKSRKTDPFMSLVASMCIEDELGSGIPTNAPVLGVIT